MRELNSFQKFTHKKKIKIDEMKEKHKIEKLNLESQNNEDLKKLKLEYLRAKEQLKHDYLEKLSILKEKNNQEINDLEESIGNYSKIEKKLKPKKIKPIKIKLFKKSISKKIDINKIMGRKSEIEEFSLDIQNGKNLEEPIERDWIRELEEQIPPDNAITSLEKNYQIFLDKELNGENFDLDLFDINKEIECEKMNLIK